MTLDKDEPNTPSDNTTCPADADADADADDAHCGDKFRSMLKCVEHTGTIPACAHKINRFLICERLVFNTALRSPPPSTSTSTSTSTPSIPSTSPPFIPSTPSTSSFSLSRPPISTPLPPAIPLPPAPPAPPPPAAAVPAERAEPFTTWAPALLARAVDKQTAACTALFDTMRKPECVPRMFGFSKRIVQDVNQSCSLVSKKLVKSIRSLFSDHPDT